MRPEAMTPKERILCAMRGGRPGGPVGQQRMVNFVGVQPVFDPAAANWYQTHAK